MVDKAPHACFEVGKGGLVELRIRHNGLPLGPKLRVYGENDFDELDAAA